MTDLLHDIDAPSDAELISRVRGGDVAAYGELFSRHVEAARRLARQLVRGPDADDLVSDAFAKVLGVLQGGGGPDVAFRAYLLTAVRRLHVDKLRAGSKLQTSDDMEVFDAGVPFQDTAVAAFESGAAAKAFASLPERWQLVLWHLEVEGQKPADIAPLLGMSANSVSALAYRAREGLRQAFLTMHLNDTSDTSCRWVNEHLGAYVRNGLAKRDAAKVQSHIDECRRCTAMYLELTEVNSNLRGIIAPLLLGAAAAGYLSSTGAAGGGFGLVAFLGRARDAVTANAGAATAGAVAAGVAAVATAGIMLLPSSGPDDTVTGADDPIGQVTTPGEPGGDSGPGGGRDDREDAADDEAGENDGTAVSEEPALDATPEAVPVSDTGTESTADGGTGSETDGGTGGDAPGDGTDPNQPPAEEPPGEQPPGEQPPGEEPPGEEPPAPPGEEPPAPPGEETPPPPGEEPPPPPGEESPSFTLQVTALRVEDGQVSFDFDGVLPPVVYLSIESEPATVLFTDDGTCRVDVGDVTASCPLVVSETLLAPLARIAAAVTGEDFVPDATVGLSTPTEDSNVTIVMSETPGGKEFDRETFQVKAPVELRPDVGLADFPTSVKPTDVHDYVVTGTLSKTDYEGGVAFVVSGDDRVRFADSAPTGCTRSDTRLVCPTLDAGQVSLPLYARDNRVDDAPESPIAVRITVVPLDGEDTNAANDSVTFELERFVPEPIDITVAASQEPSGNSGMATVTAAVTSSEAELPLTMLATFDPAIVEGLPERCTASSTGATCDATGGGAYVFDVDVTRIRNEPRAGALTFTVDVPETHLDETTPNYAEQVVERFGDAGPGRDDDGSGSTDPESTADGLDPSDTSSPVVETIEEAAETFTKVARTVTLAEKRPANDRTSSTRSRGMKPAKAVKDTTARTVDEKSGGTTSRATGADRRDAIRDERHSRAETSDKKSSDGAERSQKESTDTSPTAVTTFEESTSGIVDTAVKGVKKIL